MAVMKAYGILYLTQITILHNKKSNSTQLKVSNFTYRTTETGHNNNIFDYANSEHF